MAYSIDLIFANSKIEQRYAKLIYAHKDEEIGGLLFFNWGRINDLHWKRHEKIFGEKHFGMITDWIVCPNVSNLRNRVYLVSDLSQLVAIGEQSAESRGCMFVHFHSHPSRSTKPSPADMEFWRANFGEYGYSRGAIAAENMNTGFELTCYTQFIKSGGERQLLSGRFLHWKWINYLLRRYEKEQKAGK
jgi:hypothetical protein